MKIAIIGTHGTGKTTLSYNLAAHYKSQGKSVKIIQEVARSCPFPINEKMTIEAAKWIFLEHARKELEATKNQVIISDRSVFDSFVYAEYFKLEDDLFYEYSNLAFQKLDQYDKLIYVRPDLFIHDDGVRSKDKEFQSSIDELFAHKLKGKIYHEVYSSTIFEKENEWKSYCL